MIGTVRIPKTSPPASSSASRCKGGRPHRDGHRKKRQAVAGFADSKATADHHHHRNAPEKSAANLSRGARSRRVLFTSKKENSRLHKRRREFFWGTNSGSAPVPRSANLLDKLDPGRQQPAEAQPPNQRALKSSAPAAPPQQEIG